jgi:RluA family pseudouridine synthase
MTSEELVKRVLFRDAMMLVIDKPAGVSVHAGPKGGEGLDALFGALTFGLPVAPRLAHRLDRATSGCLVLGRHRKALARLGHLFETGQVEKTYWAAVVGTPPKPAGTIDLPLKRRSDDPRAWWMRVDPSGQPARTDYRVLGLTEGMTWLELHPRTGRTHQVRVHCASLGCPVLGDAIYGDGAGEAPLHLHARAVAVPLYPKRDAIAVTANVPEHMRDTLWRCGWREAQTGC